MLWRRSVVKHAQLGVRHVSTREDLYAQVKSSTVNPITFLATPDDPNAHDTADPDAADPDDGPPLPPGPVSYKSPAANPHTKASTKKDDVLDFATLAPINRPTHRFDCVVSRNNTITTLSSLTYSNKQPFENPTSKVLAWFSGGSVGFKKAQRASYEAGHQCAVRVFKLIEEAQKKDTVRVHLYFKGFGMGREAVKTALMAAEGEKIRDTIKQVVDRTPIKIGGTRAKKARRL